jgi:hypothetical protein
MTKPIKDQLGDDPGRCIFAWWKDQSEDCQASMAAFDKLSPELREAVNSYHLNVLPETVLRAVRIWGEKRILAFLRY